MSMRAVDQKPRTVSDKVKNDHRNSLSDSKEVKIHWVHVHTEGGRDKPPRKLVEERMCPYACYETRAPCLFCRLAVPGGSSMNTPPISPKYSIGVAR